MLLLSTVKTDLLTELSYEQNTLESFCNQGVETVMLTQLLHQTTECRHYLLCPGRQQSAGTTYGVQADNRAQAPLTDCVQQTCRRHLLTASRPTRRRHLLTASRPTRRSHLLTVSRPTHRRHLLTASRPTHRRHLLTVSRETCRRHLLTVSRETCRRHLLTVSRETCRRHLLCPGRHAGATY